MSLSAALPRLLLIPFAGAWADRHDRKRTMIFTDLLSGCISFAAVVLLATFLNGFAQFMAARIRTMGGFHLVMNLLLFPLLFFSGAFFPLGDLPFWLKALATVNPLSYAVDLIYIAVYTSESGHFGLGFDLVVLGLLAPATFLLGIGRRVPQP